LDKMHFSQSMLGKQGEFGSVLCKLRTEIEKLKMIKIQVQHN